MVPPKIKKAGSRNSCHLNFLFSLSLFHDEIGCQTARNEQVQQKDCLVLSTRHFQPESLIRFECLNARQGMIPLLRKSILQAPRIIREGAKVWRILISFPILRSNVLGMIHSGTSYTAECRKPGRALCSGRKVSYAALFLFFLRIFRS
ncbi:hypothetical protein CDAR_88931 [Caerostris darwini]|uniref:Uncharacterized protein n=1 Tax=Caerostris darwini TaxID=1538125 RepID=A0AAV4UZS3_9ARAC|nr:hypothetical protein CDAR_88931 [Caerostris darwini]